MTVANAPIVKPMSRRQLAAFFADRGFTRGAEVGVWRGEYAEVLCKANPKLRLICVDPWAPQPDYLEMKNDAAVLRRAFVQAQNRLRSYSCELWRMTSLEGAGRVPDGSLDFVYIDGNHRYEAAITDIQAWAPKVKRGGIVAGHDYITKPKRHIGVEQAVNDYTAAHQIDPWYVLLPDAADIHPSWMWEVA
jgi:predicted O-methyltransferase YrrM